MIFSVHIQLLQYIRVWLEQIELSKLQNQVKLMPVQMHKDLASMGRPLLFMREVFN